MLTKALLKREVYGIEVKGQTLFYAPLTRSFALCDGIVDLYGVDRDWLKEATSMRNVPGFVREKGFVYDEEKIRLRLNVTTRCNLRCDYCSVRAGSHSRNMSDSVAINAVRGFCKFAEERGAKTLEMVFSGGEPTLCMRVIKKSIAEGKKCLRGGIKLQPRLLTNGLFNRDEYLQIMGDIEEAQISWDGFFGENQRYGSDRRLANRVLDNIRFLIERRAAVSVLMVVSESNVDRVREVVDQLYALGVRHIFLSLKENLGRAMEENLRVDFDELSDAYLNLWKDYRAFGVDINLTGTDIHSVSPFPCSVPIPNYSISPEGEISACTISFNDNGSGRRRFRIGVVNSQGVVIDSSAINEVRRFNVLNIPGCSTCFAKWHCRGGCVYAKNGQWFTPLASTRCNMIRNILLGKLLYVMSEQSPDS